LHATIMASYSSLRENMRIDGSVVLITGASEGIGAACADVFRRRGARVALVARNEAKLRQVAGSDGLAIPGDIVHPEVRELAVAQTLQHFGRIDILINNAGIGLFAPSWRAPEEDVRRMVEVNLFAALGFIRLVVPEMRARRSGMIVNVGSIGGKVTLPWLSLYSATKFALGSLTEGLRMELMPDGVRTMLVCPGYVSTNFQDNALAGAPPPAIRNSKVLLITPQRCAEDIADGVEKNKRTVITPPGGQWFILASRLFGGFLERRLAKIYHALASPR
jgi:short-subunit dehydrogenase